MFRIREKPPLRLSIGVQTPGGRWYRWAPDEPDPANVFSSLTFGDSMPGGFDALNCTLPRRTGQGYADLERFSTVQVLETDGGIAWEGRLEQVPRTSGNEFSVSPGCAGWKAHLEDDKSVREVYIDRDLSRWQDMTSARKLAALTSSSDYSSMSVTNDDVTPVVETSHADTWGRSRVCEAWYDAKGVPLSALYLSWKRGASVDNTDTNWSWAVFLSDNDVFGSFDASSNLRAAGPQVGAVLSTTTTTRTWAALRLLYNGAGGTAGRVYPIHWYDVMAIGRHGIGASGTYPNWGMRSTYVVEHAVRTWAPQLRVTSDSIGSSGFIIEQLAFLEPTTAGEIVRQVTRFGLQDWAVWENKTFYWHDRGARGKRWRARIGPSQLQEAGPQIDRLINEVIVRYLDVDGTTRSVGPVGSGATVEDDVLRDHDPENPANKVGIKRNALLSGGVMTAASAIELGRRFLEESRLLDRSGTARIVGHVEDDHGVWFPYTRVRAGDYISFVDASDPSPRRIINTSKDHGSRTCTVQLDSPPQALMALQERLSLNLVGLGL